MIKRERKKVRNEKIKKGVTKLRSQQGAFSFHSSFGGYISSLSEYVPKEIGCRFLMMEL